MISQKRSSPPAAPGTLPRRNRPAGPGGAPVASVPSLQLLPLHPAGALRLPAAREAAATQPHPGPLQFGMLPLGVAPRLLKALGGALLRRLPPGDALTPVIAPPCRQFQELWLFMTGVGPHHPSHCLGR